MALFTRVGDVSGIDPTDFISNFLIGNVANHPEVTSGMVAAGQQAFYDPMLTPVAAASTAVTATAGLETHAAPAATPTVTPPVTTTAPAIASGSTATPPVSSEPGIIPASPLAQTSTTDQPKAGQTTDQSIPADHAAAGAADGTQTADQPSEQTILASADSPATDSNMADVPEGDQAGVQQTERDAEASQPERQVAEDQHRTDAAPQQHSCESFHFATLASANGEHTVLVFGDSVAPGDTVTEVWDAHPSDTDLGTLYGQDWQHQPRHDWHMPC